MLLAFLALSSLPPQQTADARYNSDEAVKGYLIIKASSIRKREGKEDSR